jgi:hypothetical protein
MVGITGHIQDAFFISSLLQFKWDLIEHHLLDGKRMELDLASLQDDWICK